MLIKIPSHESIYPASCDGFFGSSVQLNPSIFVDKDTVGRIRKKLYNTCNLPNLFLHCFENFFERYKKCAKLEVNFTKTANLELDIHVTLFVLAIKYINFHRYLANINNKR